MGWKPCGAMGSHDARRRSGPRPGGRRRRAAHGPLVRMGPPDGARRRAVPGAGVLDRGRPVADRGGGRQGAGLQPRHAPGDWRNQWAGDSGRTGARRTATVVRIEEGVPMRGHGLLLGRLLAVCVTLAAQAAGMPQPVEAQTANEIGALKAQLERRFEVLPLQDGVLLRPRGATGGVRSVEVHQGTIAIDGQVVTGAELRSRMAGDADLVVRVSYLNAADQRALAGAAAPAAAAQPSDTASPGTPQTAAPDAPPAPSVGPDDQRPGERNRRNRGWGGSWGRRTGGDRGGDRVRFGGRVNVGEDETVDGDVVVIAGRAQVLGHVTGDVVVVGGSAELGPRADVGADVVVVGGELMRDPG